eukprot:Lankesteria_metandrocarpae@DN620_c0_g1_i1.p2
MDTTSLQMHSNSTADAQQQQYSRCTTAMAICTYRSVTPTLSNSITEFLISEIHMKHELRSMPSGQRRQTVQWYSNTTGVHQWHNSCTVVVQQSHSSGTPVVQ